jgi:predicted Rossmann fold nucleotide-binding protein DprA/Smf involved in DNA uptake
MDEQRVEKTAREKKPLDILRERRGGTSEELKAYFKEQTRIRKLISEALKKGPRTIPELASDTGEPADKLLWHVMALKKYGRVAELEERGDYFAYALAGKE